MSQSCSLRRQKLVEELSARRLDAFLVTHAANLRYLTGFTGSSGVLVYEEGRAPWALYTDGRYAAQARAEAPGIRVVTARGTLAEAVAAGFSRSSRPNRRMIGFEADHLTVAARRSFASRLPRRSLLRETSGIIERLRMVKDAGELARIRAAAAAAGALLDTAIRAIQPGVAEVAVAAQMEFAARLAGAEGMAFDTIVASGPRAALPHGRASRQPIPRRGFVVLDFGVILQHYCSDMTRTVCVGRPTREMRFMYEAVSEAQQAALSAVGSGVEAREVDGCARRALRRTGWARYFTHSTGHGLGLEVHEPPRIARNGTEVLRPGMVITIEPGIYLPGKGGVRMEDMVLVGGPAGAGCEVLTQGSRELIVL
jgi:Xaa-Pro aminopeptidase